MNRTNKNFDIKLRLNEIKRRSAQLSATCLELADLAAQLGHLRKLNERIRTIANRRVHSNRRRDNKYLFRRHLRNTRIEVSPRRNLADEL
jgi:hypothetical protein